MASLINLLRIWFMVYKSNSIVKTITVSICKKNQLNERLPSPLEESSKDFVIGITIHACEAENKTIKSFNNDYVYYYGRTMPGEDNQSHTQITEIRIADRVRKRMDSTVVVVKNRVRDAILTGMDSVVIPGVELAVSSFSWSLGHGPKVWFKIVAMKNFHFSRNTEDILLMMASSRADLNIDQSRIDDTQNYETIEDGNFPILMSKYDPQMHTHHCHSG